MSRQHYASTGLMRAFHQVRHALRSNDAAIAERVSIVAERLRQDEKRIARALGRAFNGLDVLIIGPGPYLVEPRFFGRHNRVTAIDLDVIPHGYAPGYEEYRETYDDTARPLLSPEIRAELAGFDEEELLTFEVYFLWKKP